MCFKKYRAFIIGTGVLMHIHCALPVSPPENWPPEEDIRAPAKPIRAAVTTQITVDAQFRRAVRISWLPVVDRDVIMYRIIRTRRVGLVEDPVSYYQMAGIHSLFDVDPPFPVEEDEVYEYLYSIEAIDSTGNISEPSDSHRVALVAPPALTEPLTTVTSVHPRFTWTARYDEGKEYEIMLVALAGDTLLYIQMGPIYEKKSSYTYAELVAQSSLSAPTQLEQGQYFWWVTMVLVEESGKPQKRTGLATATFTVQ